MSERIRIFEPTKERTVTVCVFLEQPTILIQNQGIDDVAKIFLKRRNRVKDAHRKVEMEICRVVVKYANFWNASMKKMYNEGNNLYFVFQFEDAIPMGMFRKLVNMKIDEALKNYEV